MSEYFTLNCQLCNTPITQNGPKPGRTICKECLYNDKNETSESETIQFQEQTIDLNITVNIGESTRSFLEKTITFISKFYPHFPLPQDNPENK